MSLRTEQFDALFNPRGVVVAGASSHPGKFGFVTLHNILAAGYEGPATLWGRRSPDLPRRGARAIVAPAARSSAPGRGPHLDVGALRRGYGRSGDLRPQSIRIVPPCRHA